MTVHRTRIKICGLTREADVLHAVQAGADAIGFVLYPPSPRHVTMERAATLARLLPPFVTPVLLFVNADPEAVEAACRAMPQALLQFHGDESSTDCERFRRPYLRALRVPQQAPDGSVDLLECAHTHPNAQGILLDAEVSGYGGGGKPFNWNAITCSPSTPSAAPRLVLSGGLTAANVTDGIRRLRPWAVDVSSGVESAKGLKDPALVSAFIAAVREADRVVLPMI